jgi:ketosteroid isomerase-like protein
MSRTSGVFRSDGRLWELTTVEEADDPVAIAAAARRLLTRAPEAVERARAWIARTDEAAAATWRDFTDPA